MECAKLKQNKMAPPWATETTPIKIKIVITTARLWSSSSKDLRWRKILKPLRQAHQYMYHYVIFLIECRLVRSRHITRKHQTQKSNKRNEEISCCTWIKLVHLGSWIIQDFSLLSDSIYLSILKKDSKNHKNSKWLMILLIFQTIKWSLIEFAISNFFLIHPPTMKRKQEKNIYSFGRSKRRDE